MAKAHEASGVDLESFRRWLKADPERYQSIYNADFVYQVEGWARIAAFEFLSGFGPPRPRLPDRLPAFFGFDIKGTPFRTTE